MSTRPYTIGIAGGSASGKSTLAEAIAQQLGARCLRIAHDRYYHSVNDASAQTNFDHPDALHTAALIADLQRLKRGASVALPSYDFATHQRRDRADPRESRPIVLVEGILVLAVPELCAQLDLKVFVSAPDDVRLIRRLRRDVAERGRSMQAVLDQYEHSVRPMHQRFVAPSEANADLTLDGTGHLEELVRDLISAIPAEHRARGA